MTLRIHYCVLALFSMVFTLGGCDTRQSATPLPVAAGQAPAVDIVIITVIPEEYHALVGKIRSESVPPACTRCVDRYAWVRTPVSAVGNDSRTYQVVVGMIGEPGLTAGALAVQRAVHRFQPRYILLVGVAGGIPDRVDRGDVVVADAIWNYDYGSLEQAFKPRLDFLYRPDRQLLEAALSLQAPWQQDITAKPPAPAQPALHRGPNGSGYKVVEHLATGFVDALFRLSPDMITVEMEGAGAAAAVEEARQHGTPVGLLMIRGISDIPESAGKPLFGDKRDRELWKAYAADAAASFALSLIRHNWPGGATSGAQP